MWTENEPNNGIEWGKQKWEEEKEEFKFIRAIQLFHLIKGVHFENGGAVRKSLFLFELLNPYSVEDYFFLYFHRLFFHPIHNVKIPF